MDRLLSFLGDEVEDADEEAFLLASQQIPSSRNLGFVDPKASTLELEITGKTARIRQSPGLLESNRSGGTTGAVLWKITPFFASWIAQPGNLLAKCGVLSTPANPTTTVLELGCGISGLVSLALANRVKKYVNTDQDYVLKLVRENVGENYDVFSANGTNKNKKVTKHNSKTKVTNAQHTDNRVGNIITRPLDWETSDLSSLYRELDIEHLDLLISCDCIYNEALVEPLVTTMRDICCLASSQEEPTIVVVAQQLRAPDVSETWLTAFCTYFRCWRVPDGELSEELREGSGYVVHIGILK